MLLTQRLNQLTQRLNWSQQFDVNNSTFEQSPAILISHSRYGAYGPAASPLRGRPTTARPGLIRTHLPALGEAMPLRQLPLIEECPVLSARQQKVVPRGACSGRPAPCCAGAPPSPEGHFRSHRLGWL